MTTKLNDAKPYHKNPRKITERQMQLLRKELEKFGDLSGIVHDLNSNEIIGGNQRQEIFADSDIVITDRKAKPDKQGTVAWGFVKWKGYQYTYRQVKWTPKQCEEANIVANKLGGVFDMVMLVENFDLEELKDWGFEDFELEPYTDDIEPDLEKVDIEGDKEGRGDYLVLEFDPEDMEYYHPFKSKMRVMDNTRILRFKDLMKIIGWNLKNLESEK